MYKVSLAQLTSLVDIQRSLIAIEVIHLYNNIAEDCGYNFRLYVDNVGCDQFFHISQDMEMGVSMTIIDDVKFKL